MKVWTCSKSETKTYHTNRECSNLQIANEENIREREKGLLEGHFSECKACKNGRNTYGRKPSFDHYNALVRAAKE